MAEACAIHEQPGDAPDLGAPKFGAQCDPARLKAVGDDVRARLIADPQADHVDFAQADVFIVPDFLPPRECQRLVKAIDREAVPSTLYRGTEQEGFRTSSTRHFGRGSRLTQALDARLSHMLGIGEEFGEPMQGQRYLVGQEFRAHHDFFHVGEGYWQEEATRGGQRTWTAMVFLDEPLEGGETNFPLLDIAMRPQTGGLVIWNNMDGRGHPNMKTLHAAIPVRRGVKHVITKWFRLDPWQDGVLSD